MGFDCDRKYVDNINVCHRDSINDPCEYKFICTNPPYLHKNKADENTKKRFFSGYHSNFDDLYQISIFSILNCQEGILIVPMNFLSAENSGKIRDLFFNKFRIALVNFFAEQVFDDTTNNVISFYFERKMDKSDSNEFQAIIFPEKRQIALTIEKKSHWQLGGDFISKVKNMKNHLGIRRLTEEFLHPGEVEMKLAIQNMKDIKTFHISAHSSDLIERNILILRAIDSKMGPKIQLEDIRKYGIAGLVGKKTSRNMAHIIFKSEISIENQKELMIEFNNRLNDERKRFFSFFLTNFRDNNRKRMSFELAYKFLNYIYSERYEKQPVLL